MACSAGCGLGKTLLGTFIKEVSQVSRSLLPYSDSVNPGDNVVF